MIGTVRHYDWGDHEVIPRLLGVEPDGRPHAELWFGTHPAAPSMLGDGDTLESATGPLPYLVKVLAAGQPLSLQVHPSIAQAQDGCAREDAAGIPLDAPQRTYRDPFHKPEILVAMTPFEALCGIAPIEQTDALLAALGEPAASIRATIQRGGVDAAIGMILHDRPSIDHLVAAAAHHDDPRCVWLTTLVQQHPGDPTAALVLLLNYVALTPGEAVYLGAGNLHAYLRGAGVEVMAMSDNVVRAGLTHKHIDADELLRVLDTTPLADPVVRPVAAPDGGLVYPVPVTDFRVASYTIDGSVDLIADGAELYLCTNGETTEVGHGECALASDGEHVELVGTATVFRVGTSRVSVNT
ncbi:MAG TPA: mannose-6-phosphate isomerase, class I [Ilumatobacteraceae bacterium]|nr:mannose-6-phosphate isomerase, class I [Ilumatobacteraceae bacterium]